LTARGAFGLRAHKGGAVAVGLVVEDGVPRVLLSVSLETSVEGDRLSFEPYRVASEMARDPDGQASADAIAAVAEGRGRQAELAAKGLRDLAHRLEEAGHRPAVAALLVNRAGWITDVLDYSLAWPDHVPVAETLAVRDALRSGLMHCGIDCVELDEKSLFDGAAEVLGLSRAEIEAQLKSLGVAAGKPWRKEQKLACLAAWIAVAIGH
jgi:hypothetical protein